VRADAKGRKLPFWLEKKEKKQLSMKTKSCLIYEMLVSQLSPHLSSDLLNKSNHAGGEG
jgi:hypothetical protein